MMPSISGGVVLAIALCASAVRAYYVPGTYPQEFEVGNILQAQVNSLTSFDTELPYEYYTLPFCRPPGGIKRIANSANPGTILQGLRIENSPYNFTMKVKETGKLVCEGGSYTPLTKAEVENLKHKIDNRYRINMLLDNLPITVYDLLDEDQEFVRPGFELGYVKDGKYYINNHLVFNILVYMTHGEYTFARNQADGTMALESMEVRRALRASGATVAALLPVGGTAHRRLMDKASAIADAAKKAGDKVVDGAVAVVGAAKSVAGKAADGAAVAADTAKKVAGKAADGASAAAGKAADGASAAVDTAKKVAGKAADGASAAVSSAKKAAGKALGGAAAAAAVAATAAGKVVEEVAEATGSDNKTQPTPYFMVVGFEVSPCSIKRQAGKEIEDIVCGVDNDEHIQAQEITEGAKIVYTYDVYWQDSKIKWASRWDAYLRMPGGKVHWFSIMNSILVVLVMATIVGTILVRTVRRDLAKYEQLVVDGNNLDFKDEAGWKLLTGDAFRAPHNGISLAMQIGSGVQIMCTFVVTLLLATLGFLSPAARGALLTTTIVLYVSLAFVAGYTSVLVWGLMERSYDKWTRVCGWVSVYYPGIIILIFTVLNLFISHTGTTGAVPIGMYFGIVSVWFLISIPLTFVGGYLALRTPIASWPVKTNQIPRHIPPPALAANPTVLFFAAGILPFGTMFIELYFAMTSLWLGYFYYLFGFVFIIGLLTVVINAEIAILCTYIQLCAEDYLWWWGSFRRGGSVAFYLSLYAAGFLASSLVTLAGFTPILIYSCYMAIFIVGFYLAMGTVGFASSLVFVHAIFGAVKND